MITLDKTRRLIEKWYYAPNLTCVEGFVVNIFLTLIGLVGRIFFFL